MTKRKSQAPSGKKTTRKPMELTNQNIRQAVTDLEIRQPLNKVRVVGSRLELHLRSGDVLKWPETPTERKKRLAAKPKPKPPPQPAYDSEDRKPEEE